MAVYGSKSFSLTTTATDLLTVPSGKVYIVCGMIVSNIDGTNGADVSLSWKDSDNSDKEAFLAKVIAVPAKSSLDPRAGSLVLCEGDKLVGQASANDDLELSVSWLEMSAS